MRELSYSLVVALFCLGFLSSTVWAGGLLGNAINVLAPGVGTHLDKEHDRFKKRFKEYKRLEEGATNLVKKPITVACTTPFQALTNAVIAQCSNWDNRMEDRYLIQQAKADLINAGVLKPSDFEGVQIRWCPLSGAHGMAPDRGRVYLDVSLKGVHPTDIAGVLAHEIIHIQQYKRYGTDDFKCRYSKEFIRCNGCQDRKHSLEREAYEFEDQTYIALNRELEYVFEGAAPPPLRAIQNQWSRTCQFTRGRKAGWVQYFPAEIYGYVIPARPGDPCQDGHGSWGIALADGGIGAVSGNYTALPAPPQSTSPRPVTYTLTCRFTTGPLRGQTRTYPNGRPALIGSACTDGISSSGVAVAP